MQQSNVLIFITCIVAGNGVTAEAENVTDFRRTGAFSDPSLSTKDMLMSS